MHKIYGFFLLVLFAGAALPLPAQNAPAADNNAAIENRLLQLEADFARATAKLGGEGFASFFADDAVTFPQNGKIATGKPKADWKPTDFQLTWRPEKAVVAASGDLGYTYGYYQSRAHAPQGDVVHEGKYTTIWRRQKDGSWKVVLDIGTQGSNDDSKPSTP